MRDGWANVIELHARDPLTATRLTAQLRACEAAALAFCRLLERWGKGDAVPATAGAREAALRHAADRAETAIAGLHGVSDILRLALHLEKDSILFYHELLAGAPWPEAKALIEKVIAEERRHVVFIHEKLESLGA